MIGSVVGARYELLEQIGETPVFKVYSAKDKVEGIQVTVRVLKQPFSSEPEFISKLEEVVRQVSAIDHPGLEKVHSVDSLDGSVFIISEEFSGSTLADRLRKLAAFSVPVTISTAISLCEALSALHRAGMAHGDLSAENVVILPDGDVKLLLPCLSQAYSSSASAGPVMLPKVAPYLAPEISRGALPGSASDVYSVGVLLYEMLTGRFPFHADTSVAMAMKHVTDPVPSVRMMNPSVPQVLDEVIKKSMAKDTVSRYRSATSLAGDLRIVQDALRFGKSLTWPLSTEPEPTPEEIRSREPVYQEHAEPAVPKMTRKERKRLERENDYPADVPTWIKTGIAFFSGLLVVLVIFYIIFNMNPPTDLIVPDLKRMTVAEATDKLAVMGLSVQVTSKEFDEQIKADGILRSDPPAGQKAREKSIVNVVVSSGSRFVEIPDLRGMTVEQAKEVAKNLSLNISDRIDTVRDKNVEEGQIVSQVPAAREKHERFTQVKVKVSAGSKPAETVDKDANTKYFYTVTINLSDIENTVNLRVDMTDSKGTKTVHESDQDPNAEVEISAEGYGKQVTFRIFYDGQLVKSVQQDADETGATDAGG